MWRRLTVGWGAQGSKHTGVCPDNADVRCSTLSNSTEGVWHVQGGVLRGNWLEGDWWSLPLRTSSYSTQLDAVLPDEFVKVRLCSRRAGTLHIPADTVLATSCRGGEECGYRCVLSTGCTRWGPTCSPISETSRSPMPTSSPSAPNPPLRPPLLRLPHRPLPAAQPRLR